MDRVVCVSLSAVGFHRIELFLAARRVFVPEPTDGLWRVVVMFVHEVVASDVGAEKVRESVSCSIRSQHYHPHPTA